MTTVVEINSDSCGISVSKGFLLISVQGKEEKIPFSDIEALIINSHGAYITNQAIMRLGGEGIPIVHCGGNAMPCALTLPCSANVYRKSRIELQAGCSLPLKKKLWQLVVSAKVRNQAAVLKLNGKKYLDMELLAGKVLSGDTGNVEATAARFYWERLFGKEFRRNPDLPGINSFLNYGYAILRAVMCRYITASGLLPELGIHHQNQMDPYCLADDLMEPFRPFTDLLISALPLERDAGLTPNYKKKLIGILDLPLEHNDISTHLRYCMQRAVEQFIQALESKKADLQYPRISQVVSEQLREQTI